MPKEYYGIKWDLLNQQVTRQRPIMTTSARGSAVIGGYSTQLIMMRLQEFHTRPGKLGGEEEIGDQGIVTHRKFVFDCNYKTDKTLTTNTDIQLSDRLTIVDAAGVTLELRVADFHDAAGQRHHINGVAVWTGPTGD